MTNAEAWFNKSLRPRKPEGSLGRTAQDVHLDSHTAPERWSYTLKSPKCIYLIFLKEKILWCVRWGVFHTALQMSLPPPTPTLSPKCSMQRNLQAVLAKRMMAAHIKGEERKISRTLLKKKRKKEKEKKIL